MSTIETMSTVDATMDAMPQPASTALATPDTPVEVNDRVSTYRAARAQGSNGRILSPSVPVQARNPALSPEAYRASSAANNGTGDPINLGITGLIGYGTTIATFIDVTQHQYGWGLPVLAAVAATADAITARGFYRRAAARRKYGSRRTYLRPQLATAWYDWHTALDGIRALGDADEAYDALLRNDDRVRAVILALDNGTLTGEDATANTEWLYETCAKAHRLHEMERNRKQLADAITHLSLPDGDTLALDTALSTSQVLTINTKQALSALSPAQP